MTAAAFLVSAAVGTLVRFAARIRPDVAGRALAMMIVNLAGAFLLGILVARADRSIVVAVGIGGLGSLTSFSTYMLDTMELAERGTRRVAAAYVTVTLVGGVALADLGLRLGG